MQFRFGAFADEAAKDFAGQIEALKRNRYEFLEIRNVDGINFTKLTLEEAKKLQEQLKENGLSVRSLGSPIGKIKIGDDFDAHLELTKHTLEMGNIFGSQYIRLFSFFMPKEEDPTQYRNLVIDRMGVLAETAASFGIQACHENEKGIYGDVASRCREIHEAVPQLKAVFDPANFVQCGQDTLQAWEILSPYVEYMHIKDAIPGGKVVPPGQGVGNVPQLLAKYAAQGGQLLTLEPHLTAFVGLKSPEQEGEESVVGALSFETAEGAFDYAANKLKNILEEIV
jgi:sugar phosphate isomerase/epimerase